MFYNALNNPFGNDRTIKLMLSLKLIRHARIEARRLSKSFCQTLVKIKYHNFYAWSLSQKCLLVFNPGLFLYNFVKPFSLVGSYLEGSYRRNKQDGLETS